MIPLANVAAHAARVARNDSHIYYSSNLYIARLSARVALAARVFPNFCFK